MATIETRLSRGDVQLIEADLEKTLELDPSHVMAKTLLQGLRDATVSPVEAAAQGQER